MPIEMPRGLPFSVDTWTPSSKLKRSHFLTHAHKDHAQGILSHASYPIYSTLLTKILLRQFYPQLDDSMFVAIEVGQSLVIQDPDGDYVVTAFDANHCPGAVMFLFEGSFGNIFHTGDCRLTPECFLSLPDKYIGKKGKEPKCPLDYIFLDCTFGQYPLKMPSKYSAKQQVINCIWNHPDARAVYLACDLLGQEEILVEVSQAFGEKIYVDKARNLECFNSLKLIAPEIISEDPSSRFQLFDGFPKLYERAAVKIAEARANFQHEPLILRPSSQWYVCNEGVSEMEKQQKARVNQAVKDIYGVWHVCYSIHSSREELDWALQLLGPKWVVSTTPSCRAMELDYVKKHCFKNRQAFDDSLCKLLDINAVEHLVPDGPNKKLSSSNLVEDISNGYVETQSGSLVISTYQRKRLSLSPPGKRPLVTLFGQARLGLPYLAFPHESKDASAICNSEEKELIETKNVSFQKENVTVENSEEQLVAMRQSKFAGTNCSGPNNNYDKEEISTSSSMAKSAAETKNVSFEKEEVAQVNAEEVLKTKRKIDFTETNSTELAATSTVSSSNSYGENLRRLYRPMNVPVRQRLPSLVMLMKAKKSARKRT
ncbi:uncharacterized protein LOC130989938 [Salvia miltiorrhiza]|uniref:uncharacterized protein LOC130989938 n=1 Tax=Salvia miltiorrhiza TaxID=226208 RepID=UPI0025AB7949|nr:uncharacterized protein LOC130989938 [Salvia miltiorrhiza]